MRLLFCLLTLTSALLAEEPVPHLAASARLFLRVSDGSPPIGEVRVSPGVASPGNYESTPEKRERLTDINVPIHWWRWTKVEVSFTPTYDGTIELDLNGPWGEARSGVLQQMEVLWQNFSAIGSTIENSGFPAECSGSRRLDQGLQPSARSGKSLLEEVDRTRPR